MLTGSDGPLCGSVPQGLPHEVRGLPSLQEGSDPVPPVTPRRCFHCDQTEAPHQLVVKVHLVKYCTEVSTSELNQSTEVL